MLSPAHPVTLLVHSGNYSSRHVGIVQRTYVCTCGVGVLANHFCRVREVRRFTRGRQVFTVVRPSTQSLALVDNWRRRLQTSFRHPF